MLVDSGTVQDKIDYIKFCKSVLGYVDDSEEENNMLDAISSTMEEIREMGYEYDLLHDTLTKIDKDGETDEH